MNKRVSAIIINDGKILLIKRVKLDRTYYTFPGGGVEEGEGEQHAMWREIKEELSIDAKIERLLFEIDNRGRREFYYLISEVVGIPRLGGPEKERMNEQNQYLLEWIELLRIGEMNNLYPEEAVEKLLSFIQLQ